LRRNIEREIDQSKYLYVDHQRSQQSGGGGGGDDDDDFIVLRALAEHLYRSTRLGGISGIRKAHPTTETTVVVNADGKPVKRHRHVIVTEGTHFKALMNLSEVDFDHSTTNNMHEIEEWLGIETLRNWIGADVSTTLRQTGGQVGPRHLQQMADTMTRSGKVRSCFFLFSFFFIFRNECAKRNLFTVGAHD
jgi:DNA-directed RNA polymerase beta' subunit